MRHPLFARVFTAMERCAPLRHAMAALRREAVAEASGDVLEIGAGAGPNFPLYMRERARQVTAIEPEATFLAAAHRQMQRAAVPIRVIQASVESLSFAEATFDSAVATLVFCSVEDPSRGLAEVARVLKPGGTLALLEHVRAPSPRLARLQDALVPVTTRLAGNCHWNRDTASLVAAAGFADVRARALRGRAQPVVLITARRP